MKSKIIHTFLYTALLLPMLCYAQQLKPGGYPLKDENYEKPDDPYLPNAYNNEKLSPAYSYDSRNRTKSGSSEIFTKQVNVHSFTQQNFVGDAANEPNMAVNPLNENEIVIGWRQFNNVQSNFRQAGWAYSSDGGQTWTFPGSLLPGIFASDPVLDYDSEGNFYYNSLLSSSADDWPCYIFRSSDGGKDWDNGVLIGGGDKQWMTIDRTEGIGKGNIYSAWSSGTSECEPGFFTRSTDGGDTYDTCYIIPDDIFWATEAIGNEGELYVAGGSPTTAAIKVAKSINAQDPEQSVTFPQVTTANLGGFITGFTPINPVGATGQIYVDVDRSDGPGRGNVYVLGSVQPYFNSDPSDIMFNKSTDGGLTWNNASPKRINLDHDTTNIQWFGTMSVAPNGRIDVIWLDTRDNPGSHNSALYYSYSHDQGDTWSANEKLSESFDPHVGYPNQPKMGDYIDMISNNTGAHVAWVNTFSGGQDVYYSFITPQEATSSDDVSGNLNVEVHPNPTSGMLEISGGDEKVRIEIYTALGQKVYSTADFATKHEVDITSQSSGIYFLKMISEDHKETVEKIIRK